MNTCNHQGAQCIHNKAFLSADILQAGSKTYADKKLAAQDWRERWATKIRGEESIPEGRKLISLSTTSVLCAQSVVYLQVLQINRVPII